MKMIDISVPIKKGMPVWPKSPGIHLKFNPKGTLVSMDVHSGTHIDAPLHFISGGDSVDKIPLETLMGPTFVAYLPRVKSITAKDLENLNLPKKTSRLLFRTSNSNFWKNGQTKFQKDFVGLTPDAAVWLAKRGIRLVGMDYLSVAKYEETVKIHRILLKKGVILLEGLNLSAVKPGIYQLICLPMKLINTEAAPARAVLLPYLK